MIVRVIEGPAPIVTPADIAGGHDAADAKVAALIMAIQRTIDGPSGWLGRALGVQTLELVGWFCERRITLPYPPVIGDVVLVTEDDDGLETPVVASAATYRLSRGEIIVSPGASWVTKPVHRIRYQAGYNGTGVADGGTGAIPEEAKQAVILCVQHMMAISAENLFLRSEEVEGVGTFQYTVSDQAGEVIRKASENLLQGLRIYV